MFQTAGLPSADSRQLSALFQWPTGHVDVSCGCNDHKNWLIIVTTSSKGKSSFQRDTIHCNINSYYGHCLSCCFCKWKFPYCFDFTCPPYSKLTHTWNTMTLQCIPGWWKTFCGIAKLLPQDGLNLKTTAKVDFLDHLYLMRPQSNVHQ